MHITEFIKHFEMKTEFYEGEAAALICLDTEKRYQAVRIYLERQEEFERTNFKCRTQFAVNSCPITLLRCIEKEGRYKHGAYAGSDIFIPFDAEEEIKSLMRILTHLPNNVPRSIVEGTF